MCGITGFSGKKNSDQLTAMLNSIKHRGPDGEGRFECKSFSIGMRRLAIIDPESGWQPIWNEDKSVCIVFNGEIYNYEELWAELKKLGHKFATDHSDTETLVHAYEQWGEDMLTRLRGMFAFAIYDLKKDELFIARDHFGIKPFYYTYHKGQLFFASELKALFANKSIPRKLNKEILNTYLLYRVHDHSESTFFEQIKRLPAGHYMKVNAKGHIYLVKQYWQPDVNLEFGGSKSDLQYAEEFKEVFIDSVRHHLIADVPVGVSVSGGLDSTGILSVVSMLSKQGVDLHTKGIMGFSTVFPGDPIDETKYIETALSFTGTEKHYVSPTVEGFWEDINDWIVTQEEPTISSAPYAGYCVMREAAKYVRVMLSGQGGDEMLAGYIPYFNSYLKTALNSGRGIKGMMELLRGLDLYAPFVRSQTLSRFTNKGHIAISDFMSPDLLANHNFEYVQATNLNQRLWNDVSKYSVPNILRYEDKNAMAFSIETRVPFLDKKVAEYVFSLPVDQKIKMGWNRYIYRNAMKGIIPEEIRMRRKKIGFTTPEIRWIKSKSSHITQIFLEDKTKLFDNQRLAESFLLWKEGKLKGDGMIFWRALNTIMWINKFNISI